MTQQMKRRTLHVASGCAWVVSAALLLWAIQSDHTHVRMLMTFGLSIACTLTCASLLVALLGPLHKVYQAGYQDGIESTKDRPMLSVVNARTTVTPFRARTKRD